MIRHLTSLMLIALITTVCATAAIANCTTPGDLDGDGDVDLKDWCDFKHMIYMPMPGDPDPRDFNGDGDVDLDDYVIFRANFTGSDQGTGGSGLDVYYGGGSADTLIVNFTNEPISVEGYTVYSPSAGLYSDHFYGISDRAAADPMWVYTNFGTAGINMDKPSISDYHVTELAGNGSIVIQPGFQFSIGDIVPCGVNDITLTYVSNGVVYKSEPLRAPNYPGDTNGDGDVDLDDFALLKSTFGQDPLTDNRADFDLDGDVDLDDFIILKEHFGHVSKQ